MPGPRVVPTDQLTQRELRAVRVMLEAAFDGGLTDEDWDHTLGGLHVILLAAEGDIVSHAAIVDRLLVADDRQLRTGYVEGVATSAAYRRGGHASAVMREVGGLIQDNYELGALATGVPEFYARLGWELWRGPTWASSPTGPRRTADEDGAVMVLRTVATAHLDVTAPLMCDWRPGDLW